MARSRLRSNLEKQTTRNVTLALLGIIVIFALVIVFGMQFLLSISSLVEKFKGSKDITNSSQDINYIAPPILNPILSATNSAKISVEGFSTLKLTVKLYVNGRIVDTSSVKDDKSFIFRDVPIESGENSIHAKAVTETDRQSDFSNLLKITYNDKPPTLDIEAPQEGKSFSKDENPVKVSGRVDQGVKVTVNDFWAIVDDQGKFYYMLKLHDGENDIKIIATDTAGNKITKDIKVKLD